MSDALAGVIARQGSRVYRMAWSCCRAEADDITQEVFLRYLKKQPNFHDEEHRRAWFIRVTVNCCNKLWGSAWRRKTVALEETLAWETPEDSELHDALQQLPPKYREVIHLYYYEDMPTADIAAALHRKDATVRTQLTRARELLRQILKEEDDVSRTLSAHEPSDCTG